MSSAKPSTSNGVKKHEEADSADGTGKDERRDPKPVKTLNRVPRACNACRKQKMRCEGADNPPCRRCRHNGLECLFEKPSREPTLTGEAGLERIKSLEAQVSDIRQTQVGIHNTLIELVHQLRSGAAPSISQTANVAFRQSPSSFHTGSPASMPTPTSTGPMPMDTSSGAGHVVHGHSSDGSGPSAFQGQNVLPPLVNQSGSRQSATPRPTAGMTYRNSPGGSGAVTRGDMNPPHLPPPNGNYSGSGYSQSAQGPTLPPISSFQDIRHAPANLSSVRYHNDGQSSPRHGTRHLSSQQISPGHRSPKRKQPGSSNVTSSNTSDYEDEDNGDLPSKGLVAPWEVLRGLADVAAERAAQESGDTSEPSSRQRSLSPDPKRAKPPKRRKTQHRNVSRVTFSDVVSKKIITEAEARELFKIYYAGCSTFLPVFDSNYDTYESLHERSPFAFDCICCVAAKVRDGGGTPSETYLKCWEEVQTISCATLFAPVQRQEAVQAMILVSGWSENGWLSGGHAVRMAVELSMHQAWPKLYKRIISGKASDSSEDRRLISASRVWFCLYLFEHQMSYGTGRPAILKDDESIYASRVLLKHPLAIQDDMRLCSTVELMAIRERIHNKLSPDHPIDENTFTILKEADSEFRNWFTVWDAAFSQRYEDAAFYRQSLLIQQLHAQLFHNAYALRGIDAPEDAEDVYPFQKQLALDSLQIAQQALQISVSTTSYREGLKYAVHYTHATATFTASFLLRLSRLFPEHCDQEAIRSLVEKLIVVLSEIPARRYAYTLQLMLKKSKSRRRRGPSSRSPTASRLGISSGASQASSGDRQGSQSAVNVPPHHDSMSPTFERSYSQHNVPQSASMPMNVGPQFNADAANLDQIWRGFEGTSNEQLPMWLSDSSLGGNSITQLGLEAFMMPQEYEAQRSYATPQIW